MSVGAVATAFGGLNGYWGQYGSDPLRTYCDTGIEYVSLAFINSSPENQASGYPGDNFAGHCSTATYTNDEGVSSNLLSGCADIKSDLSYCQDQGVKVLLSIGGVFDSVNANYNVSTDANGVDFADFLYKAFGPYDPTWDGPRPFDPSATEHNAVDGFDFDIEIAINNDPYIAMIDEFRSLDSNIIITGAPECPTGDMYFYMKDMINRAAFDALFIQFYNNEGNCNADDILLFNYNDWEEIVTNSAQSQNAKLYVGLPAASDAATNGYVTPDRMKEIVCELKDKPHFGGLSLWDLSRGALNEIDGKNYNQLALEALDVGCDPFPSTTTTAESTTAASTTAVSSTEVSTTEVSTTEVSTTAEPTSTEVSTTAESTTTAEPTSTEVSTTAVSTTEASSTTAVSTSEVSTSAVSSTEPATTSEFSTSALPTSSIPFNSTVISSTASTTGFFSSSFTRGWNTTMTSATETETTASEPTGTETVTTGTETSNPGGSATGPVTSGPVVTSTAGSGFTTSTVFTTTVYTVTECPPSVTNCPARGHVTTETIALYTTVCPLAGETSEESKPTVTSAPAGGHWETKTIYTTEYYTITKCPPSVTNCPVGKVSTSVAPWTTTVVYVTETETESCTEETAQPTGVTSGGVPSGNGEGCTGEGCVGVEELTTTVRPTSTIYRTVVVPPATMETKSAKPSVFTPQAKPSPTGGNGQQQPSGVAAPTGCNGAGCPGATTAPSTGVPTEAVTAGASTLVVGVAGLVAMVAFQVLAL